MKKNSFVEYALDCFQEIGLVQARAMFGGYGLYYQKIIFSIIANDIVYLKVDDTNRKDFEEYGMEPFTYTAKGKEMKLSYYQIPESILEDREQAAIWAKKSWDISNKNQKVSKKSISPKNKTSPKKKK